MFSYEEIQKFNETEILIYKLKLPTPFGVLNLEKSIL